MAATKAASKVERWADQRAARLADLMAVWKAAR
jgi:hypothetical protein